jgi:signal transduction histidine kinase
MRDRLASGRAEAALAALLAVVVTAGTLAEGHGLGTVAVGVLLCAPVVVLRRHAAAATCAAAALGAVAGHAVPDWDLIVVCVLCFGCGAYAGFVPGAAAAGALLASLLLFTVPADSWVPLLFCTVGPWAAGRAVRARAQLVAALAVRARELEEEEAALAELSVRRERARIARELHDIVAHHVAVMVLHAGAGRLLPPGATARAAERLAGIGEAGEQALADMDRLMDVLGEAPAVEAGRLRLVVQRARAAGLNVRVQPLPALAPDVEEAAASVVQEALTNALKHAPGAEVTVRLAVDGERLRIDVSDSGAAQPKTLAATGAGLGLTGLRERVAEAGGELHAAARPGGGWRVQATLPLVVLEPAL